MGDDFRQAPFKERPAVPMEVKISGHMPPMVHKFFDDPPTINIGEAVTLAILGTEKLDTTESFMKQESGAKEGSLHAKFVRLFLTSSRLPVCMWTLNVLRPKQ